MQLAWMVVESTALTVCHPVPEGLMPDLLVVVIWWTLVLLISDSLIPMAVMSACWLALECMSEFILQNGFLASRF